MKRLQSSRFASPELPAADCQLQTGLPRSRPLVPPPGLHRAGCPAVARWHACKSQVFLLPLLALFFTLALPNPVSAASYSWTIAGNSTLGGNGAWDTSSSFWWDGASAGVWPSSGINNDAVFAGTAGNVTVDPAGVVANDIAFNTTGYILTGSGNITLNGTTPTLTVGSGLSATIGNNAATVLAGSAGVTKAGAGTLTLSGNAVNTFTGGLNVNGGTVALSLNNLATPTNLIDGGNALSMRGATLAVTGNTSGTTSQTFAGTSIATGTSSISLNKNGGASSTLNLGTISHSAGGVVNFATNTTMTGTVSTTEMIKVSNGTSGTNGGLAAWAVANGPTTAGGRWVAVDSSGALKLVTASTNIGTNWGNMTSSSNVYTASASVTLSANATAQAIQNNGTGLIAVALGTNTLTANGLSAIQSGASNIWSFTASGAGGIKIGSEKELVLIGAGNFAFSAPISDSAGGASGLTHAGGGTVSFTGTHAYTGQTTVNSGILQVSTGGSINTSSGITINGGTFLQNNNSTAVTPTITLQGGTIGGTGTINTVNVSNLAANTLSNGNGTTSPLTIGNLTFSGAATVNVNTAGSAAFTVTNTLATTPANGQITLNITTAPTWVIGTTYNLIGYGSFAGSASDFTKGTIPNIGGRMTATLGTTGATNGFVTLAIGGDNAIWTGDANGNWTTTAVGAPYNWKTSGAGTGTEFLANDIVIFNDSANGTTSITIPDANVATTSTQFDNSAKNYTVSGAFGISSGALTKSGTGILTLNNTNTFTGGTTINAGTLQLGNATDTLANTGAVNISGGTLDIGANSDTVGVVTLASGNITGSTGNLTGSAYNVQTGSISAKLAGNSGLTKSASGTVTLTGALNTTNTAGSVIKVTGGSFGADSILTLSPTGSSITGATSNNNSVSIGDAFGDYAVFNQTAGTVNSTSISIGNLGTGTYNLSGGISNTNGLTMSFTGPQSGTGETFLNVSGSAALNIYANGILKMGSYYNRKSTIVQTGGNVSFYSDAGITLGGTGGLAFNGGAGTYTLSGGTLAVPAITLLAAGGGAGGGTGTINLDGGTLKITNAAFSVPTGVTFNVKGNGTLANSGANIDTNGLAISFNAALAHSGPNAMDGGLTKLGAGSLTLTGNNTYTGATTVTAGTLVISGGGSISTSANITVATGATLSNNSTAISNALLLAEGATLSGNGTFSPSSLTISADLANGFTPVTVSNLLESGTLTFTLTNTTAGTCTLFTGSPTGSFSSVSVGATQLTGTGTFTGTDGTWAYSFDNASNILGIAAVPEPGTWILVGIGLTFLLHRSRRRFEH